MSVISRPNDCIPGTLVFATDFAHFFEFQISDERRAISKAAPYIAHITTYLL